MVKMKNFLIKNSKNSNAKTKMDINKLTIEEAKEKLQEYKEIAKIFNVSGENVEIIEDISYNPKKYYIVRTYSAGVFAGNIVRRVGKEVKMKNARRIWHWDGAASLSQLAMDGTSKPSECKFPKAVDNVELTEAIEILECTDKAEESIKSVPEWKI